jgi:hypothetical protein
MDRFNSNEEIDWFSSPEYLAGMEARRKGLGLKDNPHSFMLSTSFINKSAFAFWNAGWADQDMIFNSEANDAK